MLNKHVSILMLTFLVGVTLSNIINICAESQIKPEKVAKAMPVPPYDDL